MIMPGRFLRSALLFFFSLAALIHFYFNRTTINPHYGKAFYRLGRECQDKCGLDEQLFYFQKAAFYDPNLTDAYYRLGIIYGKQGQIEKEFVAYKKTAALDHTNADAYFKVGRYHFEKGELEYALRYFLHSDRHKPGSYDPTLYYIAQIYEKKQMYNDAVRYYVRLLTRNSSFLAEVSEKIWRVSKIPDQQGVVLDEVYKMRGSGNKEQEKLWEQIDQYLRTDQVPEFMRKPMETGAREGYD